MDRQQTFNGVAAPESGDEGAVTNTERMVAPPEGAGMSSLERARTASASGRASETPGPVGRPFPRLLRGELMADRRRFRVRHPEGHGVVLEARHKVLLD